MQCKWINTEYIFMEIRRQHYQAKNIIKYVVYQIDCSCTDVSLYCIVLLMVHSYACMNMNNWIY